MEFAVECRPGGAHPGPEGAPPPPPPRGAPEGLTSPHGESVTHPREDHVTQLEFIGQLDATEVAPDVVLVAARGPIDGPVAAELRDLLLPLAAADGTVLVLDLSEAHGLDAETLSVVSQAAHLAACRGERLAVMTHSRSLVA